MGFEYVILSLWGTYGLGRGIGFLIYNFWRVILYSWR